MLLAVFTVGRHSSITALAPFLRGYLVEQMLTQWVFSIDVWVLKILTGIQHTDFLHHRLRTLISGGGEGQHFGEFQVLKGIGQGNLGRLGGVTLAPMGFF